MAKRNPRSLAKEAQEAATLLQKLVRMEEADDNGFVTCVTCGKVKQWNDGMQGGHWIPRGRVHHMLNRANVHAQCSQCNGPNATKIVSQNIYTMWMIDKYGREFVDDMLATQSNGHRYTKQEIRELQEELKEAIKKQEIRLGLRSGAA